jgi:hypothetical protein
VNSVATAKISFNKTSPSVDLQREQLSPLKPESQILEASKINFSNAMNRRTTIDSNMSA